MYSFPALLRLPANVFRLKMHFRTNVTIDTAIPLFVVFTLDFAIGARLDNRFHFGLFRLPDNRIGIATPVWQ